MSESERRLIISEQMIKFGKGRPPSKRKTSRQNNYNKSTKGKSSGLRQGANPGRSRMLAELEMRSPIYETIGEILPSTPYSNKANFSTYYHNRWTLEIY